VLPVPIAGPAGALTAPESGTDDPTPLRAVRDAAVIFPPRAFVRVGLEQVAADSMVNAELSAPEPGELAFRLVRAGAVIGLELDRVIDPLHREGRMQDVPCARFVGMNFGSVRHGSADCGNRVALPRHYPCPRLA
jgi:hypothetical protein